jgi:hypothetical protein
MDHDHAASQATFLEITFGINILLASYSNFRDYLRKKLDGKISEHCAIIQTLEEIPVGQRFSKLQLRVGNIAKQHHTFQSVSCMVARAVSLATAVVCLAVLYFDLIPDWGLLIGCLILPLPVYLAITGAMSLLFQAWVWWITWRYKDFLKCYEPHVLQEVQAGLESLK